MEKNLECPIIKRNEIICDVPRFVLNEKTCKLIHVSLNKNSVIFIENITRDFFVFIVK